MRRVLLVNIGGPILLRLLLLILIMALTLPQGINALGVSSSKRRSTITTTASEETRWNTKNVPTLPTTAAATTMSVVVAAAAAGVLGGLLVMGGGSANAVEFQTTLGDVWVDDPLILAERTLRRPQLVSADYGGAIVSFANDPDKLLKISWANNNNSIKQVKRECQVLQTLQAKHISGAERCLGEYPYSSQDDDDDDDDKDNINRIMILVEPYLSDAVLSIKSLDPRQQEVAVRQTARTLVQMVAENTVTLEITPLYSKGTGDVIFVDMTEAVTLKTTTGTTMMDRSLMESFVEGMWEPIPSRWRPTAVQEIDTELSRLRVQDGKQVSDQAMGILRRATRVDSR
jgi:hypothetical protein